MTALFTRTVKRGRHPLGRVRWNGMEDWVTLELEPREYRWLSFAGTDLGAWISALTELQRTREALGARTWAQAGGER